MDMRSSPALLCAALLAASGCTEWEDRFDKEFECSPPFATLDTAKNLSIIAFGSCGRQDDPEPILADAALSGADLFVFLGDNVYIDSEDCQVFFDEYSKLACKDEFAQLVGTIPTQAVWDDHDYGKNDAGMEYPMRDVSKDVFVRFWREPDHSQRLNHPGIYHSLILGDHDHRVQLILLDMRTFRSPLTEGSDSYMANWDPAKTFLGAIQWAWFKEQLKVPAKVRIIASSTQFGVQHNGWEAWANFPEEQRRMAAAIAEAQADGVVFLSGDVHYSELSRQQIGQCYPLYDCTASGFTDIDDPAPNMYRIGEPVTEQNFGKLTIDWDATPVSLTYSIHGLGGTTVYSHTFGLDEISF